MALPVISSATLNKTSYAPGELMVLTVVGSDTDEKTIAVEVRLRNVASGEQSAPVSVNAVIDELQAVATEAGRTWTQTNRVGNTFTLTATA